MTVMLSEKELARIGELVTELDEGVVYLIYEKIFGVDHIPEVLLKSTRKATGGEITIHITVPHKVSMKFLNVLSAHAMTLKGITTERSITSIWKIKKEIESLKRDIYATFR